MRSILLTTATLATTLSYADGASKQDKMLSQNSPKATDETYAPKPAQGFFVSGDFLYWIAHEGGLEYATRGIKNTPGAGGDLSTPIPEGRARDVDFSWDPGFRIGAGYTLPKSFWDLGLTWTSYHTRAHGSASHEGDFRFNPLWSVLNLPGVTIDQGALNSASAKWNLCYNTVDLELSRYFFPNKYLSLKPHAGLRAAWIHQHYNIRYLGSAIQGGALVQADVSLKNHNDYSGAGFKIGLDSLWHFNRYFGLFANGSFSLLGGSFSMKETGTHVGFNVPVAQTNIPNIGFLNTRDNFFAIAPEIEVALGFNFQVTPKRDHYRFELNAGWEYLLWFEQNQMRFYVDDVSKGKYIRERANLQLMGFTLNAALHF